MWGVGCGRDFLKGWVGLGCGLACCKVKDWSKVELWRIDIASKPCVIGDLIGTWTGGLLSEMFGSLVG